MDDFERHIDRALRKGSQKCQEVASIYFNCFFGEWLDLRKSILVLATMNRARIRALMAGIERMDEATLLDLVFYWRWKDVLVHVPPGRDIDRETRHAFEVFLLTDDTVRAYEFMGVTLPPGRNYRR